MKLHSTLVAVSAAALLSACASSGYEPNPTRDTAVGAAAGAAIGALAHGSNRTHGALAGAAIGALGGYVWSSQMEKQKKEMEQATRGTGVQVTQTADNQLKLEVPSDISFDVGRADDQAELRADPRQVRAVAEPEPGIDGPHHRPHRQHRQRRDQQSPVGEPRRQHARLPDRARGGQPAHRDRRARVAAADRRQRDRSGPCAQSPRRDLRRRGGPGPGPARARALSVPDTARPAAIARTARAVLQSRGRRSRLCMHTAVEGHSDANCAVPWIASGTDARCTRR